MPIPNQTDMSPLKIYTSTQVGGVQVFETPAASVGLQGSAPATETITAAGLVVPPRQVLGEYNEVGNFAAVKNGEPAAGQVEGVTTVMKVAAQSTSTGNEQNNTTDSLYLHTPWATKVAV